MWLTCVTGSIQERSFPLELKQEAIFKALTGGRSTRAPAVLSLNSLYYCPQPRKLLSPFLCPQARGFKENSKAEFSHQLSKVDISEATEDRDLWFLNTLPLPRSACIGQRGLKRQIWKGKKHRELQIVEGLESFHSWGCNQFPHSTLTEITLHMHSSNFSS